MPEFPFIAPIVNNCNLRNFSHVHCHNVSVYKPHVVRVTLGAESQPRWKRLRAIAPDLTETQLAAMVMGAALRAMDDADYRISLPITFTLGQEVPHVPSARR